MYRSTRAALGVLLTLALMAAATAQDCSKLYKDTPGGLLFARGLPCRGNCKTPRDDYWGRTCAFNSNSGWGVCSPEQTANSFEYAKTLGGGAILDLTPCDLLPYLRGRTLWLLGDSHAKTLYRALQCFLIDFWNHQECETSTDSGAVQALFKLPERQGNQKCIHLTGTGGGRICMVEVVLGTSLLNNNNVAAGGVLPLLRQRFAKPEDIFYINFGVWHKKKPEWWASLRPALTALGQDYQRTRGRWPHVLFMETPAEHPKAPGNSHCQAMRGYTFNKASGRLEVDAASRVAVQGWNSGASLNTAAKDILGRHSLHVVPAFDISVPLHDNHIGWTMNPELDCLHYCHPGVPQTWVWYMYDAFRNGRAGVRPLLSGRVAMEASAGAGRYKCVPSTSRF